MSTCYEAENPAFLPASRLISAITQANPAVITTHYNHWYTTGLIVRIEIPDACGMTELNGRTFAITVTGNDTLSIPIDSADFQAFVIPAPPFPEWANTCALIIPIGEETSKLDEATRNVLPY